MGCASSKHHSKHSRCRHCKTPYSSLTKRSFSMNLHHPWVRKRESYNMVALASSTYGSLKVDPSSNLDSRDSKWVVDGHHHHHNDHDHDEDENHEKRRKNNHDDGCIDKNNKDYAMEVIEAKAWSKMIDQKITRVPPKTPTRTPPGEPETINVKDLMEGLEDNSPLRPGNNLRSFSFHVSRDSIPSVETPRPMSRENAVKMESPMQACCGDNRLEEENGNLPNGNVISVSDFNPEVISAFRKALEELPPSNPFYLKPLDGNQHVVVKNGGVVEEQNVQMNGVTSIEVTEEKKINGDVVEEKRVNVVVASSGYAHVNSFVDKMSSSEQNPDTRTQAENGYAHSNGYTEKDTYEEKKGKDNVDVNKEKERVILYFTSLRGVRKTYEDCCYVRLILKGLGVRVDERDVSMHAGFKEELRELQGRYGISGRLPKVFMGEKCIGGVEEIQKLHEDGKLEKTFQGCERWEDDSGNLNGVCEGCGDIRFVPCESCSGSCKIYYECEDDNEENEDEENGFQRCPDCNENGLVRCPICCSS